MSDPSSRLLSLLSLLQTPREWPGSELARRLEVSPRTVRRDVERLRDLGYPVHATKGVEGGYRLAAGTAMPPLLLDDEEAVAIAVGLRVAAGQAVAGIEEASVRALTKLEQVLPSRLRYRVGALGAATVPLPGEGPAVDPRTLTLMAAAIANHERVRFGYRTGEGVASRRLVEPFRLVSAGRRWYLVGFDTDRDDWRIYRVDRITEPTATGARSVRRELPEDPAAFVTSKLYSLAPTYRAVAVLDLPAERVPPHLGGELTPLDDGRTRWESAGDTVEWLAFRLLTLGCEFLVQEPPELVDHLRATAGRATRAAGGKEI